jgi:hypothetical protein
MLPDMGEGDITSSFIRVYVTRKHEAKSKSKGIFFKKSTFTVNIQKQN